jgi:Fe(3+) dicitrate transport protein
VELPSGLTFELEGVYNDAMFTDDLNTVPVVANGQQGSMPSFTIWNATVNYKLPSTGWTFFGTVKNLGDEVYVADMTRGMIPGSPRLVQGGVSFRF